MRKLKFVVLCLLAVVLLAPSFAGAEVLMNGQVMTGSTLVRLIIPGTYVVEIPATLNIPYEAESTPLTIGVSSMEMGPEQAVKIAVDSARGNLLRADGNGLIPYVLMLEDEAFGSMLYSQPGQTELSVQIALADWYKAAAGEYAGTVTFRVSMEVQEVEQ